MVLMTIVTLEISKNPNLHVTAFSNVYVSEKVITHLYVLDRCQRGEQPSQQKSPTHCHHLQSALLKTTFWSLDIHQVSE